MIHCKTGFPEDRRHRRDRGSTNNLGTSQNKVIHKSIIMVTSYKLVDYVTALIYLIYCFILSNTLPSSRPSSRHLETPLKTGPGPAGPFQQLDAKVFHSSDSHHCPGDENHDI